MSTYKTAQDNTIGQVLLRTKLIKTIDIETHIDMPYPEEDMEFELRVNGHTISRMNPHRAMRLGIIDLRH